MKRVKTVDPEAVAEKFEQEVKDEEWTPEDFNPRFDKVVSTGSTLLDLSVSGKCIRGGGLPGGIAIEIFGGSGLGKTALACEIGGSVQFNGGEVKFNDPESRLDTSYANIYGMDIREGRDYKQSDTVSEFMTDIGDWVPANPHAINAYIGDSLAALSTDLEMEKGDKMGMRRAKEFSEGFRKIARLISHKNKLLVCTNQVRQGEYGDISPGGNAIGFYSSLRLQMFTIGHLRKGIKGHNFPAEWTVESDIGGKTAIKTLGITSAVRVVKSTVDEPFRWCPLIVWFGYGVDDVRANLQWMKDIKGDNRYDAVDKTYQGLQAACDHIEEFDLQEELREMVIDTWEQLQNTLDVVRKPKMRR